MKVAVVGRGNVGGGLANLWETGGHEVTRIGREGGDVSEAEAVLVAVPGGAIAEALDNVRGIEGKTVIDATNLWDVAPPAGFSSNAEFNLKQSPEQILESREGGAMKVALTGATGFI